MYLKLRGFLFAPMTDRRTDEFRQESLYTMCLCAHERNLSGMVRLWGAEVMKGDDLKDQQSRATQSLDKSEEGSASRLEQVKEGFGGDVCQQL